MRATCHVCKRTGEGERVFDIIRRDGPPMPQFIIEGKDIGLPAKIAWCTLCPPIPPAMTKLGVLGGMTPFTDLPALMIAPIVISKLALEYIKGGIASDFGRNYFQELVESFSRKDGRE